MARPNSSTLADSQDVEIETPTRPSSDEQAPTE
jgi:hypothetical protein